MTQEKINIAELLKDCPIGMELDCTSYDNVSFDKISDNKKDTYPILCYITDTEGNRSGISFTENGCESRRYGAKCVIFPKGKTTWEGFHRPFRDGDIISDSFGTCIFKGESEVEGCVNYYCGISNGHFRVKNDKYNPRGHYGIIANYRLATEEEKEKLFQAIKKHGYKWNAETKTLEKLTEQKFDITTLKPFDKILVRETDDDMWIAALFSHLRGERFYTVSTWYSQCIPFEENQHLLGTTDDCDEYYKTFSSE